MHRAPWDVGDLAINHGHQAWWLAIANVMRKPITNHGYECILTGLGMEYGRGSFYFFIDSRGFLRDGKRLQLACAVGGSGPGTKNPWFCCLLAPLRHNQQPREKLSRTMAKFITQARSVGDMMAHTTTMVYNPALRYNRGCKSGNHILRVHFFFVVQKLM